MNQASLRITRAIAAPIDEVFQAWTDPAVMARWFFAGERWTVDVENDLRVGGAFSLLMHGETESFLCSGVYREIAPPTRLVFTWTSYAATDTLVTLELQALPDGTQLTLTHDGLADPVIRQNHADGWSGCLANFDRLFAAGASL